MIIFSNLKIHFLILGIFSTLNTITLSEELSPKKTSYITEEEQAKLKPKGHTWQLGYNLFFNRYHNITNSRGSKFFNKNIQYTSNKETIVYNLPTINIVHDMSVNNSNNSTFPNTSHFSLPTIQIPEIQQISLSYSGKVPIINSAYINFNGNSSQSSYFSQQNINSNSPNSQGKMDIVITNQKVNIKTDNIKFTGIQDQNHNIVSTTTDNLNIDGQLLPNIFTSTSAQPLTIDNIILDISNNTKPNLDELETLKSSIFLITPYQSAILGDMSITLGHNFNLNFNANSSISFVSVADSNRDSYNVGYINNGYIEAKGIKSLIFLHTKPEFTNHTGMSFLQNNGTLKLSGERIMGIGEFGVPTSFENNGEFIIGGFNNVGLYYLNISTPSELILNSPIRIIGNNSMGIVTLGNTQFANPETIKIHTNQNAYESTNPNIHSTAKYRAGGKSGFYRPAKINIEITGNQNIAFNALNLTSETAFPVYLDNYTITSYLGNNNVLMRYYLFNSVELKNDVIGSLKIVGGEKNTALRIFKTNLNHTGNITITDSIQSIGVYNSEGHFINNGTIEVSSPSGFGLISNNAINENYGTINLTEKLDILNDFQHNYSIGVLLSNHSHFLSTGNLTIDVTNYNSAGILANKESNAILSNTIINAKNGARNMGVTQGGSITLDTNNRFNTYENSLFIYNTPDNPGKIIFKNPVTANIYGNHTHYAYGTGLFLNGDNREDFTTFLKNYDTNYHENTLKNLTLNLIHGRGFYIKDFSLNLSDTDITSLKEYGGPNITGQDYKTLLMDNSHLTIDKDVNLDTENLLSKIDIINSSITNNATITNKNNGGIGLSEFPANTNQHNTIINNGNIEFGGSRSIGILVPNTGIFNVQNDNLIKLYGSDVLPTIGIYNRNPLGTIINNKDIISSGNINYGIYSVGDIINNGTIDFSQGVGNIGILNLGIKTSTNNHTIIVGASSPKLKLYGIGMVAKNDDHSYSSNLHTVVINEGSIDVNGNYGIGMYADGSNSKIINKGSINLNGEHTIGMFIDHGATGENYGRIIATPNAINSIGALLKGGSTFINYGEIIINSPKSTDVMIEKGSNYQQINDNATNIEYIPPSSSNEIETMKKSL